MRSSKKYNTKYNKSPPLFAYFCAIINPKINNKVMKRISLLVSAGLLSLVAAAGSQVPYTSEFTDGWTVVDANNDGIKWGNVQLDYYGKRDTGCENGAKILTNSNYSSDDWIISPAVTLTAGKKYKIVFWDTNGEWRETFSLHIGRTNTVAGMNAGTTLKEFAKRNSWEASAVSFTPTQSGDYYFGFHAASSSRSSSITLTGFQVKEFNVTPAPVSWFSIVPSAGFDQNEVGLQWLLPTKDTDSTAFIDGLSVSKVYIYRDDALVKTLTGPATSWADTAATGFTPADHKYGVEVEVDGNRSTRVEYQYTHNPTATADFYKSDFSDPGWTIINANNDQYSWDLCTTAWRYSDTGYVQGAEFWAYSPGDDWIISPAVRLTAGREYKVRFWHIEGQNDRPEDLTLYAAQTPTVAGMKAGKVMIDINQSIRDTWAKEAISFTPTETGNYYFGFHAHSKATYHTTFITGLEVSVDILTPAKVSDLTVKPAAGRAIEANLSWTLPTKDADGADLPAGSTISNVYVYRDDVLAQTLPGDAASWTDNAASGLTEGKHTYAVEVELNGIRSARSVVRVPYIGLIETQTVPFDAGIASMTEEQFNNYYAPFRGPGATFTGDWELYTDSETGTDIRLTAANIYDNWLIFPPLAFDQPGVYVLNTTLMHFDGWCSTETEVYLGSGYVADGYTRKLDSFNNIQKTPTEKTVYFEITEPGTYNIAIRGTGPSAGSSPLRICALSVQRSVVKPAAVSDLAATVTGDSSVSLTWTNPTLDNTGKALSGNLSKIEVTLDGTLVSTLTAEADVTPGNAVTCPLEGVGIGIHEVKVTTYINSDACDTPASLWTAWVGDKTQTLPYSCDFSDSRYFSLWSTHNNSNDPAAEWKLSANGGAILHTRSHIFTDLDYTLLSAPFDLVAGHCYKFSISESRGRPDFSLNVGIVPAGDQQTDIPNPQSLLMHGDGTPMQHDFYIVATETGKFSFAIQAKGRYIYDDEYYADIIISKVEMADIPYIPDAADMFTVRAYPNHQLIAGLTWQNPTTSSIEGMQPNITKAEIYRNNELISTYTENLAPGGFCAYTDDAIPEAGVYAYKVKLYNNDQTLNESGHASTGGTWFGYLEVPYEPTDFYGWMNLNSSGTGGPSWKLDGDTASIANTKDNSETNARLTTPPVNTVAGEKYLISVLPATDAGNAPYDIDVYLEGSGMNKKIGTITCSAPESQAETAEFKLLAVEPETSTQSDEPSDENARIEFNAGFVQVTFHATQNGKGRFSGFRFVIDPETGIDEAIAADGIRRVGDTVLFPNGATDITLATVAGQVLRRCAAADSIDLSQLAPGIYIVSCNVDGKRIALKIAK